ncbi:uncharacterized protein F4822DRAFT_391899 [Hypoxylon trugodes]|uniref:uncharacterized protein n=1 Tax=Hypoxylon trugodes TaxID=326681 RepID=UPI0021921031|nr:uncharacterized protein F4822DRAFT_391899 [Hypoxylon trugodes]KAI1392721.1 hypothetical protein F4822DRAFT_391899 [Hypoxylon trugodes]
MALVDYSSDSESEAGEAPPATTAKRQKTSHDEVSSESSALPPLPASFHDLYASTVRVSTTDDPTLHQGRKRVNPHKVGNWPSHVYIEWHPTPTQRTTLTSLLSLLQQNLASLLVDVTSLLTSDLGAPQPLHVSLSRPLALTTAQKDVFLERLETEIARCGGALGGGSFDLVPRGLEWHRTRESERSFLVLRVGSARVVSPYGCPEGGANSATGSGSRRCSRGEGDATAASPAVKQGQNPELAQLLQRCNTLAQEFGQPPLYAFNSNSGMNNANKGNDGSEDAFHISIAWSHAAPSPEMRQRTEQVYTSHSTLATLPVSWKEEAQAIRVPVSGIKVKIGNVVTHVALPVRGKRGASDWDAGTSVM